MNAQQLFELYKTMDVEQTKKSLEKLEENAKRDMTGQYSRDWEAVETFIVEC